MICIMCVYNSVNHYVNVNQVNTDVLDYSMGKSQQYLCERKNLYFKGIIFVNVFLEIYIFLFCLLSTTLFALVRKCPFR